MICIVHTNRAVIFPPSAEKTRETKIGSTKARTQIKSQRIVDLVYDTQQVVSYSEVLPACICGRHERDTGMEVADP